MNNNQPRGIKALVENQLAGTKKNRTSSNPNVSLYKTATRKFVRKFRFRPITILCFCRLGRVPRILGICLSRTHRTHRGPASTPPKGAHATLRLPGIVGSFAISCDASDPTRHGSRNGDPDLEDLIEAAMEEDDAADSDSDLDDRHVEKTLDPLRLCGVASGGADARGRGSMDATTGCLDRHPDLSLAGSALPAMRATFAKRYNDDGGEAEVCWQGGCPPRS